MITDYNLIADDTAYRHKFHLYDETTGTELTNLLEVHTLELPKLPKENDSTKLWDWMKFFKVSQEEELAMLEQQSPALIFRFRWMKFVFRAISGAILPNRSCKKRLCSLVSRIGN